MVENANSNVNFASEIKPIWCPGCGNYGLYAALKNALTKSGIEKENVLLVSGIGCSSDMPHPFSTYGIDSLHGRILPVATGAKLANKGLTVIGVGGDGDGYGIGVGHLIHAARRNINMTYIVNNNQIYGLTTGQASPTSMVGAITKSTPTGCIEEPENPISVALSAGASYVARGFSGDPMHLESLINEGIAHRGFSIIDVLSPCVTFNTLNTYDWYRQRVYKLEKHDPSSLSAAMEAAQEPERSEWAKIPIGLFYKKDRPVYDELDPTLAKEPLVKQQAPTKQQIIDVLEGYK